jgi:hypothetical protein
MHYTPWNPVFLRDLCFCFPGRVHGGVVLVVTDLCRRSGLVDNVLEGVTETLAVVANQQFGFNVVVWVIQ